ncbi:hypothetical protein [Nonomuraea sp. NPDC005692]|uniref:hypothetical protein n=1 Tax=Nonomuraea sp. NPDC005692 TaxID=3157168 RepID=UPI0033C1150F
MTAHSTAHPTVRNRTGPPAAISDEALLELSRRRPERFGELYDRYVGEIHAYLGRRLDQQAADDLTAEVFLAALGSDDRATVGAAARLLLFAPVTSRTRAAAYRLLASLPGVTAAGPVTDVLGRAGQAVEYDAGEFAPSALPGAARTRLVIDPVSGSPLSVETRSVADGLLLTYVAIKDSRWADVNPLKENR